MLRWVVVLLIAGMASRAFGQTDAGGLFQPWPSDQHVQSSGEYLFEADGHIKDANTDFQLSTYSSSGRWRVTDQLKLSPTFGYSTQYLNLHSNDPRLPEQLTDTSVGFGTPIMRLPDEWFLGAVAAIGYAGNAPFGEGNAGYLHGDILVGKQLSEYSSIIIGVDYNGNRTIWQDMPIPGFGYSFRVNPTVFAVAGFPYNNIDWHVTPKLDFKVSYNVPSILIGQVEYAVGEHFSIYGHYEDRIEAFRVDDTTLEDRLFFESHRGETGFRWTFREGFSVFSAIGYAFGQEFETGFDTSRTQSLLKVSDEIYTKIGLEARF